MYLFRADILKLSSLYKVRHYLASFIAILCSPNFLYRMHSQNMARKAVYGWFSSSNYCLTKARDCFIPGSYDCKEYFIWDFAY